MERLTDKNVVGKYFYPKCFEKCDGLGASSKCDNCEFMTSICKKLGKYEDLEEQGRLIKLPCKVGDTVYLIDRDENNKFKVYEGKWKRVSLVQASKDGSFNLCGEISYDMYDCFYDDGRIMSQNTYVGQEHTKIGEVVFFTKSEAEAKLEELGGVEDEG